MKFSFKRKFTYRGVKCVIVEVRPLTPEARKKLQSKLEREPILPEITHNGYIEVKQPYKSEYSHYNEKYQLPEELTFSGTLPYKQAGKSFYLGFDTLHLHDMENPETTTYEAVKERTRKLADALIKNKIIKKRGKNASKS